jgi:hypothetical protein
MRTLRELYGWVLGIIAWAIPFAFFVVLGASMEGRLGWGAALLALAAVLLVPRLILSARRFREPLPEDLAEADERRPVILVHGFAHVRVPLYARLFAFQPGLWRELADLRQMAAIQRGLGDAGPIVPVARPAPPPAHGPMASQRRDAGFGDAIEARLRSARMAVIVVDGAESNLVEIERAARTVGLKKTVLVAPSKVDDAFLARWEALRARTPDLPTIDPRVAAVRWADDGTVGALCASTPGLAPRLTLLRHSSLMLRKGEARVGPKAPSVAKLLLAVPVLAGVFGAVVTAFGAEWWGHRDTGVWVTLSLVLGVVLAVMGRRAIRLVPANALPMVATASLPWWLPELATRLSRSDDPDLSYQIRRSLDVCAVGAMCAASLLAGTAVLLAGASLMRRMPGRRPAYAIFGVAPLIPLAAILVGLPDYGDDQKILLLGSLLVSAVVLGLCAIAASGDAGRAHAPLPLGAASAAVMGLGAVGYALSHGRRTFVYLADQPSLPAFEDTARALDSWSASAPWFLLAVPFAMGLIAMQFRGRVSRVSIGNVAALLPLVLVLPLATANEAPAREHYAMRLSMFGGGLSRATGGDALVSTFAAPRFQNGDSVERVDVVVDSAGAIIRGRRVATPSDLVGWGGPDLNRELSRLGRAADGDGLSIAIDEHASAGAVVGAVRAALANGAPQVWLVGRDEHDLPRAIAIHPTPLSRPGDERIRLLVVVRHDRYLLVDSAGTLIEIPDVGGQPHVDGLRERLQQRRMQEPNRRDLEIAAQPGVEASRLARAVEVSAGEGFDWLSLLDASQL